MASLLAFCLRCPHRNEPRTDTRGPDEPAGDLGASVVPYELLEERLMDTTRKDFGATIATLARLYKEAQAKGDGRRARVYAKAVDLLMEAWPSEPEAASSAPEK